MLCAESFGSCGLWGARRLFLSPRVSWTSGLWGRTFSAAQRGAALDFGVFLQEGSMCGCNPCLEVSLGKTGVCVLLWSEQCGAVRGVLMPSWLPGTTSALAACWHSRAFRQSGEGLLHPHRGQPQWAETSAGVEAMACAGPPGNATESWRGHSLDSVVQVVFVTVRLRLGGEEMVGVPWQAARPTLAP